jgi:GT2 family glycosyltransferase
MLNESPEASLCSVVVFNYRGLVHLEACLSSLVRQTYKNYEVFVLDYGGDGSQDFIRRNYAQFKIIYCPQDNGSAGGCNYAAKHIDNEYLLFLANDIECEEDLIEKLMGSLLSQREGGLCSAKMRQFSRRNYINQIGFSMDVFGFPCGIGAYEKDEGRYDQLREAMPSGTVLLIRKSVFDRAGGFDDKFFTLADELDLAWRIRLLGYKTLINPSAVVYHKTSATLSKRRSWQLRYYSEKNTIRMLMKNYAFLTLIFIMPLYGILLFAEAVFYIFIFRFDHLRAIIKAVFWNIINFKSTWQLHRDVQRHRTVPDAVILRERVLTSYKFKMFLDVLKGKANAYSLTEKSG